MSVLHLVRPTPVLSAATGYLGEEAIEDRLAEARALLDRFCRGIERGGAALDVCVDVAVESEAESITDAAERLGASILFLGSAVRGKPLIPALGAISRQVIRRAPCAVLTLPGGDGP